MLVSQPLALTILSATSPETLVLLLNILPEGSEKVASLAAEHRICPVWPDLQPWARPTRIFTELQGSEVHGGDGKIDEVKCKKQEVAARKVQVGNDVVDIHRIL